MDLRDAARQLGVHYMTAYGWVRDGQLRAVKLGRSYDVDPAEVARFDEARRRPRPPPRRRVSHWDPYVGTMFRLLHEGNESGARRLVDRLTSGDVDVTELSDRLLAPALRRIGDEWAAGRVNVAEEHRASAICDRLLAPLAAQPRGRTRGTVVVLTAPGDDHGLPSVMATIALRQARWRAEHLGIHVPRDDLLLLVESDRTRRGGDVADLPGGRTRGPEAGACPRRGGCPDAGRPPRCHAGPPPRRAPRTDPQRALVREYRPASWPRTVRS